MAVNNRLLRHPLGSQGFKRLFLSAALLLLSACAVVRADSISRVALVAPFEGRYREVGYNALYAARLAFADANLKQIELLPIDDGGTNSSAIDRARALTGDPLVKAVLVLGYPATSPDAQLAFRDLPIVIIGHWGAQPETDSVYMLTNAELDRRITTPPRVEVTEAASADAPLTGGEVFALEGFRKLRQSLESVTVVSSASLPDADFTSRYVNSDLFAPKPGLLATLTYDAASMVIQAVADGHNSRAEINARIANVSYDGLNGHISFDHGYWVDAPVYEYVYDSDKQLQLKQREP